MNNCSIQIRPLPLSAVHLSKKRGGHFVIASFIKDGIQKEERCFVPRGRKERRRKNEETNRKENRCKQTNGWKEKLWTQRPPFLFTPIPTQCGWGWIIWNLPHSVKVVTTSHHISSQMYRLKRALFCRKASQLLTHKNIMWDMKQTKWTVWNTFLKVPVTPNQEEDTTAQLHLDRRTGDDLRQGHEDRSWEKKEEKTEMNKGKKKNYSSHLTRHQFHLIDTIPQIHLS